MPTVIPVVGGRKSGKTTTIELLVKDLAQRGYKVAVAKYIPEIDFTIDTEGKDTWRFAHAGARVVVGISSDEVATIEKVRTADFSLDDVLGKCGDADVVFLEGFRKLAMLDRRFPKIVVAKSAKDVAEAVENFEPILAFAGPHDPERGIVHAPYVNVVRDPKRLADLVEKLVEKTSN